MSIKKDYTILNVFSVCKALALLFFIFIYSLLYFSFYFLFVTFSFGFLFVSFLLFFSFFDTSPYEVLALILLAALLRLGFGLAIRVFGL